VLSIRTIAYIGRESKMHHPLESVPQEYRKQFFIIFLVLTLTLFAVFRILDKPLQTSAAPNGIVSFELAGSVEQASAITDGWEDADASRIFAAFGLGIDYLFMPMYAFALAFGTLLVADRHSGWLKSLGAVAGYGAFAAALFDAVENYALFQILLNRIHSPYPELAYYCASTKFGLLLFGIVFALVGWLWPRRSLN